MTDEERRLLLATARGVAALLFYSGAVNEGWQGTTHDLENAVKEFLNIDGTTTEPSEGVK
jgi:hypothetical protein